MIAIVTEYRSYVLIVALILIGVVWMKSGRSPFVLAAIAMLHLEAVRLQTLASLLYAVRDFRVGYRDRVRVVREAVMSEAQ